MTTKKTFKFYFFVLTCNLKKYSQSSHVARLLWLLIFIYTETFKRKYKSKSLNSFSVVWPGDYKPLHTQGHTTLEKWDHFSWILLRLLFYTNVLEENCHYFFLIAFRSFDSVTSNRNQVWLQERTEHRSFYWLNCEHLLPYYVRIINLWTWPLFENSRFTARHVNNSIGCFFYNLI